MNIFHTIILGIVEGITEFLPISSTFHLIWTSKILGLADSNFLKLFEVFIQSGAILSIVFLYWKTIRTDFELVKKTAFAFVPTAIIGLLLYKVIKNVFFESDILMLSVFIGVGLLFVVYEMLLSKDRLKLNRDLASFSYSEAVIVGIMQASAVVPGVSRAGAVIVAMMFLKFRRDEAAKFSFLLAVPTLLAASALDIFKQRQEIFSSVDHMTLLLVGFIVSFLSAYVVVKWFVRFLQTHTLSGFGIYRIAVGLLLILFGVK